MSLWETHGKYYHWDVESKQRNGNPPPKLRPGDELIGFQQLPRTKNTMNDTNVRHSHHSTGSQSKLQEYYTPEVLHSVKKLYQHDFELWDLIKDEESMLSGSELAVKLSEDCAKKAPTLT